MKNYIIQDKDNPERTFTTWKINVLPLGNSENFFYGEVLLSNPDMETKIREFSTLYAYMDKENAEQECKDYLNEHFEIIRVDS